MPISMQMILVQHDKVHSIICNKKVKQVNNIFCAKIFYQKLQIFLYPSNLIGCTLTLDATSSMPLNLLKKTKQDEMKRMIDQAWIQNRSYKSEQHT